MKKNLIITISFLTLFALNLQGQDQKSKFLYFEAGGDFIDCEEPLKDYIRADVEPLWYYYVSDHIRSLSWNWSAGVKFEARFVKDLIGVSSGLRFTSVQNSVGKTSYWSDTEDFFYVSYAENEEGTYFAKVLELSQRAGYLTVPLEMRIYPYKDYPVNVYYKAGASFNMNIGSSQDVVFHDRTMDSHRKEVEAIIEKPLPYYGAFHLGIGLKAGKLDKPGFIIEANMPVAVLAPDKTSFVTPQAGAGFQVMVRIPLVKKAAK
jgi:hypothetical protein